MTTNSNTRKSYTEEFKRDAVRLATERGNIASVARDLGIDHSNLRSWMRALKADDIRPFPGKGNPLDIEVAELRRENTRLKEDIEILKKAVGIFTKPPR